MFLLVAGCGSNNDEEAAPPPATETQTRELDPRCVVVRPVILRAIEEGLTVSGGGSLRNGRAVRSRDFERAYFVAAEIQGAGMEGRGDIGVWVTNRLNEARGFFSVNGSANEFSDWGDGGRTDAAFSMSDDGASEAEECARAS